MSKMDEIADEIRIVMLSDGSVAESIVPPLLFVLLNAWVGLETAIWGSLALVVVIIAVRLLRRQSVRYAVGGLGGVVLAVLLAHLLGRADGFFLPGILSGLLTILVAGLSAIVGRPMVAWTSHFARRWPLSWYWHPQVRPAYNEVTWMWVLFFAVRSLVQLVIFLNGSVEQLAITSVLTGWPATIALLIISYLYGSWRLQRLRGPSVAEFKASAAPPWEGQRRGF